MESFWGKIDEMGGPAKECRFAVRIMPVSSNQLITKYGYGQRLQDLILLCEAAEFPGRGMDVVDARYYGPNIQMPYASKYEQQMNLTFICRVESYERQLFDDWMEIINPSDSFDFNYLGDYVSEIQVFQLSDWATGYENGKGKAQCVYQWSLLRAWPLQVYAQQVTWADQNILRLSVSFSYRYWYRPSRDQLPTQSRLEFTTG